jgi:flagellar biosynthesis protein FlhB
VIVNPTHIAIAIKYEPGGRAPLVVAKGRGAIALRIREEAERHGVPIMKDVPLARALHAGCEIGQEIPLELYEAVAQVLAVVMALGSKRTLVPA